MATKALDSGDIKRQEVDDMTTCCVCIEVYTEPKALPCIHTFCMKCLQEIGIKTSKRPGDEMPCPICRRLFKIPPEGFRGLPKHFFIERLIQLSNISDQSASSRSLCDACVEENKEETGKEIPAADTYCVDCNQKFCGECSRHHRKFKLTKNHKLIEINEHDGGQNLRTNISPSVCELHGQKVLDVYCADCKTVVCAICFIDDHNNHKGSHVDKFVDGFRKQIESNTEAIDGYRSKAEAKKVELIKLKEDMQGIMEKLECDVANRKDELKQLTDKHEASLLEGLCLLRQRKLKEIQMATDDVDAYLSSLETYNSYCQKVMGNGSASDLCRAFSDLSVRAVELQQQCQLMSEKEIQSFDFCFRKSELEAFIDESCDNLIGEIEESQNIKRQSTMTKTEKEQVEAKEIVKHKGNDNLRLQDVEAKLLDLKRNLEEERKFWAEERKQFMKLTQEMQQESSDSRVKMCDLQQKFEEERILWEQEKAQLIKEAQEMQKQFSASLILFCIDPKGKILNQWQVPYEPRNLSVMPSGNILLTCNARILIYNSHGNIIQDLRLDASALDMSWQAILLRSGNYLVCQGWMGSKNHRVLSLSPEGAIIKSFGSKRQHSNSHLSNPVYMTMDRNELIFVADSGNNRVVVLSQGLVFLRELLSKKDGVIQPYRVLLDESLRRVYVGTSDCQLLVFDVFN